MGALARKQLFPQKMIWAFGLRVFAGCVVLSVGCSFFLSFCSKITDVVGFFFAE
ncbi:MAG: hypothetical protein HC892_16010 [Saprospiraceae bacterium]|nr:hypothetical protein [Saprospiraceae bacterium]